MKIQLVYSHSAIVRPGQNRNELSSFPSQVRVLYEIQNEKGQRITTPCGSYKPAGYVEHSRETAMREQLQTIVGTDYKVCSRPMPDGRESWFEAVCSFPCVVEFGENQ